ncbi:type II secretion system protein [Sulfurimonas sp.]|uniref:type II secretion system protein n=1 Tax=Sulfurimonas sp. TaxID=2022749 RepID=UPI002639FE5C|nr:prepilin-type N-terminal cleavage/methylation domain-containing protein [Sulfurimonas sp.]MDD3855040.1 prepilin-type N-terminal cleavage/methylation domain-containing protein [Sulfurimonas sp.]
MRKSAFTLLELIFVIVIIGILSKFGIELLFQAYKNFIFSSVNNALQSNSAAAVETIASRLQYRIKDSVIAREADGTVNALSGYTDGTATILEWVGSDIDGFRGDSLPMWSGIIDLNISTATTLVSPGTNTGALNTLIEVLSNGGSDINDSALYFIGSDSDINSYGWNGVALTDHTTSVMHPIRSNGTVNQFVPINGATGADSTFAGTDVYEYYQLAWSAYAVVHTPADGNLTLYYDYQPWQGDGYANANGKVVLMENVDTFRFRAVGSIVKIQVCVKTDLMGDYSLCKEKTIF